MTLQEAIITRRSTRSYTASAPDVAALRALVAPDASHLHIITAQDLDGARLGSYGVITGRPAYIAVSWRPDDHADALRAGMEGQMAVLRATAAGLGTIWLGATFDRRRTESLISHPDDDATLGAVIAVGVAAPKPGMVDRLMRRMIGATARRPVSDLIISGTPGPELLRGIEAARLAPSARNRQPWRFAVAPDGNAADLYGDPSDGRFTALDCGIALANFITAAPGFDFLPPRHSHDFLIPMASISKQ